MGGTYWSRGPTEQKDEAPELHPKSGPRGLVVDVASPWTPAGLPVFPASV
jgi:hypothetical protein